MGKVITLERRRDFQRLFAQGHRFRHRLLTTVVAQRSDSLPTRVAFIVSRKVGKAVVRNKVRRRLREAWRQRLAGIDQAVDIAFLSSPAAAAATYAELAAVMDEHLRLAGLVSTCDDQ